MVLKHLTFKKAGGSPNTDTKYLQNVFTSYQTIRLSLTSTNLQHIGIYIRVLPFSQGSIQFTRCH